MINKDLIKQRFSKNLCHYDNNAFIQKKMVEKLISLLPKQKYNNILEIGCGTGLLTKKIIDNVEFEYYEANDIVFECQKYIESIDSKIKFIPCDMEEYIKNTTRKYDLIISNASFQWIENLEKFLTQITSKLSDDGVLLFSTFGEKNYKELFDITQKGLNYVSKNDILKMVPKAKIEEEILQLEFQEPIEVLKHLKLTGVNALEKVFWTKKNLQNFSNKYKEICQNKLYLTYNPIYICLDLSKN